MAHVQDGSLASSGGATSLTPTITGDTAGNLLVCFLAWNSGSTAAVATPSGWSLGYSSAGNGSVANTFAGTSIFFRIASGGTDSCAMNMPGGTSADCWAIISEFSGYTAPVTLNVTEINGGGTNLNTLSVGPSSTTTIANTLVCYLFGVSENSAGTTTLGISTPGAGTTNVTLSNADNAIPGGRADWKERSTTGTESATWTFTPFNQGTSFCDGGFIILAGTQTTTNFPPLLRRPGSTTGRGGLLTKLKLAQIQPAFIIASTPVTVTLTGVSGTGSVGNTLANVSYGLLGVSGTGSVGVVAPAITIGLTGVSATGTVTVPTSSISYTLTGVSGTGSQGAITSEADIGLAGVQGTGSAGAIVSAIDYGLVGVTATGSVGTVTASGGGNVTLALAGVSASGTVGTMTSAMLLNLIGVSAVGSVGVVTQSGGTPLNNGHSVSFYNSVAGYTSVSFFASVAQFNSVAQP
jgi:hypothetical protein